MTSLAVGCEGLAPLENGCVYKAENYEVRRMIRTVPNAGYGGDYSIVHRITGETVAQSSDKEDAIKISEALSSDEPTPPASAFWETE